MTRWLLNSAVLPAGCYGAYEYRPATKEELRCFVLNIVESRIGYEETADKILEWTGYRPTISRQPSVMAPGDVAMVVRLRYRLNDPSCKGEKLEPEEKDWEIAHLEYLEE